MKRAPFKDVPRLEWKNGAWRYRPKAKHRHIFDGKAWYAVGREEIDVYRFLEKYADTIDVGRPDRNPAEMVALHTEQAAWRERHSAKPIVAPLPDYRYAELLTRYSIVFASARKRGKACGYFLSGEQEARLVRRADGCCEVTGIPFSLDRMGAHKAPFSPSLDRVDASRGYELDNVRLVCTAVNIAMNQWGEAVFREIAVHYLAKSRAVRDTKAKNVIPKNSAIKN